jgi:hypothetical protein
MKMMKYLLVAGAFLFTTAAFAQDAKAKAKEGAKEVSKFEAGKKLTAEDLGFLDLVYNSEGGKSRGKNAEINVAGHHLHADHALTETEATEINKKIADYKTANKPEKKEGGSKSRGAGDCYYYCYYDAYGNYICYWYCY